MNSESSRSHLICCLTIKMKNRRSGAVVTGKLTLVDLAGSEVSLVCSDQMSGIYGVIPSH
jgi:hypothetical protein